jgi:DNA-binding XRE family transcriptional regulator
MSAKLKFTRNPYGLTTLELQSKDFDLELKLVSRLSKRERRAIIRGFLRHIKPWLAHLRDGAIDHPNCAIIRSTRARQRGISKDQGLLFDDPRAKLGYEIRMKRLRMGLTQKDLATKLKISRPHLSSMERGQFTPRAKTWSAVCKFLEEASPVFDD